MDAKCSHAPRSSARWALLLALLAAVACDGRFAGVQWGDGRIGDALPATSSLLPQGPGGGGSPSGVLLKGEELLVSIDCGGVRRTPQTHPQWTTLPLPAASGDDKADSIQSLSMAEMSDGGVVLAASYRGRLSALQTDGWQFKWQYVIDSGPVSLSSIRFHPKYGLYLGTGRTDMRRDSQSEQHPQFEGNGRILHFPAVPSSPQDVPTLSLVSAPGAPDSGLPNILDMELIAPRNLIDGGTATLFVSTDLGIFRARVGADGELGGWVLERGGINARFLTYAENAAGTERRLIATVDRDLADERKGCVSANEVDAGHSKNGYLLVRRLSEASWTRASFDTSVSCDEHSWPRRMWEVATAPDVLSEVYACGAQVKGQLYRSTDGGRTWSLYFDAKTSADCALDPYAPTGFECTYLTVGKDWVYVAGANQGGTWRISRTTPSVCNYLTGQPTGEDSSQWNSLGESNFTIVNDVGFGTDGAVYAALNDFATMWKPREAGGWRPSFVQTEPDYGGKGTAVAVDRRRVFVAGYKRLTNRENFRGSLAFIRRTTDGGKSWEDLPQPAAGAGSMTEVGPLLIKRSGESGAWLFAAAEVTTSSGEAGWHLFKLDIAGAEDSGKGFERVPLVLDSGEEILSLSSSSTNSPRFFAMTSKRLVFFTEYGRTAHFIPPPAEPKGAVPLSLQGAVMTAVSPTQAFFTAASAKRPNEAQLFTVMMKSLGSGSSLVWNHHILLLDAAGLSRAVPNRLLVHDDYLYAATGASGVLRYPIVGGSDADFSLDTESMSTFASMQEGLKLPTNDARTIHFNAQGRAYVGTGCFGLYAQE